MPVLTNALIGIVLGGFASALGAVLGWLSSGDEFIPRKFITGIVTGVIAGVLVGFANVPVFAQVTDDLALLVIYGEIFGTALAATLAAPKVAGAIATRVTGTADTDPQPTVTKDPS